MAKSPPAGAPAAPRSRPVKARPSAPQAAAFVAPVQADRAPAEKSARGLKTPKNVAARKAAEAAKAARIEEIFARFCAASPHPEGELHYVNPYTLLVAVALSAQATDVGVNKATKPLFALVDTPQKMVALGEDRLRDMIKTIGLYRTKAKHVIALSQRLIDDFGAEVPQDRAALETLPGVGRKTANVVLNIAFGAPLIAVDTHIFRVSNRVPIAPGKTPLAVELGLERVTPERFRLHAHHWLILHGRYVCKARRPECWRCLIEDLCLYPDKFSARPPLRPA